MPFVKEFFTLGPARPPGRVYIHETGHELFQDKEGRYIPAYKHFLGIMDRYPELFDDKIVYFIGALWANEREKAAEIFGYGGFKGWKDANPTGYTFIFRNGVWRPDLRDVENETTCEDTDMVKGREAEFRRKTEDLYEWSRGSPELPPGLLLSE